MFGSRTLPAAPDFETARKNARILNIDDQEWPYEPLMERDGYHVERWPEIKNLSQLTDGHYNLILLDIQGVGLAEDQKLQGLGILEHIKKTNPAQSVIVYSSKALKPSLNRYVSMADAVLDKADPYVKFKSAVDDLIVNRTSFEYFVAVMNRELGSDAARAPKAVQYALTAAKTGSTEKLSRYLDKVLTNGQTITTVLGIVAAGVKVVRAFSS
jgi:CheY-like chemotaxis protein